MVAVMDGQDVQDVNMSRVGDTEQGRANNV